MQPEHSSARPWRWALLWGAVLGLLFFGSYNAANQFTARRADVGVYVFAWEHYIPFLSWTILPYWSIDLLYAIALFASRNKAELFRLGKRLLLAQAICIAGFLLWPLRFSFSRPASSGIFGALFDALAGFDLPYNQAPSLHICLLVVLWRHYADLIEARLARGALHLWFALIAVSVLTTWQHHFIDLLTGFWAGALCLVLVPDHAASWRWRGDEAGGKRLRLGILYAAGAALVSGLGALRFPAAAAWLLHWTAGALACVAAIYLAGEAGHFGKQGSRLPWHSWLVFGPYLLAAQVNAWLWTRTLAAGGEVADGVFIGRQPDAASLRRHNIVTVVDLCAELPLGEYPTAARSLPLLDLIPPSRTALESASNAIEEARLAGPVWVCCALGFSRSAAAVAAWLIIHRKHSQAEALQRLQQARPQVVLSATTLQTLAGLTSS